jgi:hypothetical protein
VPLKILKKSTSSVKLSKKTIRSRLTMEAQIITVFCIIDDVLNSIGFSDDKQVQITTPEVMTIAITAAMFFAGNLEITRVFFGEQRYIKKIISKSQFNRRLHAIDESLWETVNYVLSQGFISQNKTQEYVVDSFPVKACDNIRIKSCKLYQEEIYRGKYASKREFFYGVRVHMLVTQTGNPVEYILAPGSYSDIRVFKSLQLDVPENSIIYGDSGYTDYDYEDAALQANIKLLIARRSNSKRPHATTISYLITHFRKMVETTFSQITARFPRTIHAVTSKGFELKILAFILAYSFSRL